MLGTKEEEEKEEEEEDEEEDAEVVNKRVSATSGAGVRPVLPEADDERGLTVCVESLRGALFRTKDLWSA